MRAERSVFQPQTPAAIKLTRCPIWAANSSRLHADHPVPAKASSGGSSLSAKQIASLLFVNRNGAGASAGVCDGLSGFSSVERLGFGAARAFLRRLDHDTEVFFRDCPHRHRRAPQFTGRSAAMAMRGQCLELHGQVFRQAGRGRRLERPSEQMYELLRPAADQMHRQGRCTADVLDIYRTPKAAGELTLCTAAAGCPHTVDHPRLQLVIPAKGRRPRRPLKQRKPPRRAA